MLQPADLVVWNNEVRLEDKEAVGLEVASLGELSHHNIPILHRIVVTPHAFSLFLSQNNLSTQMKHLLGSINHERHDSVSQVARYIKNLILQAEISDEIFNPIWQYTTKFESKKLSLYAHYFKDGKLVGSGKWGGLIGESVVAEHIRIAYSHLFSSEYLNKHTIHNHNHHAFSVCLFVEPELPFELTGSIATFGKSKAEYEIEAHLQVKYTFNKHQDKITGGHVYPGGNKAALMPIDIKTMLSYAKAAEKAFYLPQVLYWGKYGKDFLVIKILPASDIPTYHDTYHSLIQNVTLHPGVTIGRLRVIDDKSKTEVILSDEIVLVKKLNKKMIEILRRAKGIILEEEPHPEIKNVLKDFGIPTVIKKNDRFLYSTGDVVSLNATTGEIKRGSMLVS